MDISSIYTGALNQTVSNASSAKAEGAVKSDYSKASDEELMDACKKFEAYFVEQVLKEARKTVPDTEYSDSATSSLVSYYKDNMTQEMATKITEQGNLGLAQQMYEQMKRNYSV